MSRAPSSALGTAAVRAAVYVRMSTDVQDLSIEQQLDYIARYAAGMQYELVRIYRDQGKSGVTLRRRPGLQSLLAEVVAGGHGFTVLLVYDVSRWGRFMDVDESAYYDFLCWRAGVEVVYCAELFGRAAAPLQHLLKDMKRLMAAEHSRQLSVRTFDAHVYLLRLGYKAGGVAGYGLRRLSVRADGTVRRMLDNGERKCHQTDRVVLTAGPEAEVLVVRQLYRWYMDEHLSYAALARRLNQRGVPGLSGRPWRDVQVRAILNNEKYCGNLLYNRTTAKLGAPRCSNPPALWLRHDAAHVPVVAPTLFARAAAQGALRRGQDPRAVLEHLRGIYRRHGRLSLRLVEAEPGVPHAALLKTMFGSVEQAFRLALQAEGWPPQGMAQVCTARLQGELRQRIERWVAIAGHRLESTDLRNVLLLDGRWTVRVAVASCIAKGQCLGWQVPARAAGSDFVLCGLRAERSERLAHYVLLEVARCGRQQCWIGAAQLATASGVLVSELGQLFGLDAQDAAGAAVAALGAAGVPGLAGEQPQEDHPVQVGAKTQ